MTERYEILVTGPASPMVEAAFEDFEVTTTSTGLLRLLGTLPDAAALQGTLARLHDLRLEIIEVRRGDQDRSNRIG